MADEDGRLWHYEEKYSEQDVRAAVRHGIGLGIFFTLLVEGLLIVTGLYFDF